jgi:hypothetical protein
VEITAEMTIRPRRIRTSMDCNLLEPTDYAGRPGMLEGPEAVPYRLGPAM